MSRIDAPRWNHNIHLHRVALEAILPGALSALDVGTGNGLLAAELRQRLPDVTGVDVDEEVIAQAAREHDDIQWVLADAITHDFGRTFDVVASVATLHHFPDPRGALLRLKELTSPGGALVVVGLARDSTQMDRLWGALGVVQHQWYSRRRNLWEHTAPTVWPPALSYAEVRECAEDVLPGVRWRRYAMWRYSLMWAHGGGGYARSWRENRVAAGGVTPAATG
ncbi:MAG: putative methyltransferase [Microbacteriaceae bacterium]|nr:putative methyltransferase [Microbacteriaceae bacterium]